MNDDSDDNQYIELSSDSDNSDDSSSINDDTGIALVIDANGIGQSLSAVADYRIFTESELIEEMNRIANETASVIRYSPSVCRSLLHHFKWNKETLLERFYESGDSDAFFAVARLRHPDKGMLVTDGACQCQICYEIQPLTGLQCGHLFCRECWRGYLSNKVVDEGRPHIPCPQHKCDLLIDDDSVFALLNDEWLKSAFRRLLINSFVESNSLLKWCPGAGCGRVAKVPHSEPRAIRCDCGYTFCFNCSEQWHEPVTCSLLKRWLKKCSDDSETSNWLNANTKDCPKCHVTIEKDGGCNHMTCKNVSCRFEFCWTCLGPWSPHGSGWYSCNRFDDAVARKARDEQERSRAALQRYLHYYNRYSNHHNSLKLENKLYAQVNTKMDQMQQHSFSWIETQFLKKAVDVLSECRRTLMYTYAFAFYLQSNNITKIFEANQQDLELSTEQLSEFLERDLDDENLVTLKQKVQDKYRYVEQRRDLLLKHCVEGYENNQWIFSKDAANFIGGPTSSVDAPSGSQLPTRPRKST